MAFHKLRKSGNRSDGATRIRHTEAGRDASICNPTRKIGVAAKVIAYVVSLAYIKHTPQNSSTSGRYNTGTFCSKSLSTPKACQGFSID